MSDIKLNLRKIPVRTSKGKLLTIAENFIKFFEDTDKSTIILEGLRDYLKLWTKQDNSYIIPFLEKHKVIEVTGHEVRRGRSKGMRKDSILDKKKCLEFQKFVEKHSDDFIQIGEKIIWGKGKYARRSRLS